MKYFINKREYSEDDFKNIFHNARILDREEDDLLIIYLRAFFAETLPPAQNANIEKLVVDYEFQRVFATKDHITIRGALFEVERPKPKSEESPQEEDNVG